MLRSVTLATAFLWTVPAAAQIVVTTDGYDAFSGGTYIEDPDSNIVLTLQRELGRDGVDIRGMRDENGVWNVEYFCEPDTVLIMQSGQRTRSYYLPYLSWARRTQVSDDIALVESRRLPSMGTYASLLPPNVPAAEPEADITVRHQLRRGWSIVETLVTITNRASTPQRISYTYQDAAFMWFPDGDQRNVESVRFAVFPDRVERDFNVISAGPTGQWQFVGTFNREHGVIGGIISTTPGEVAGISGEYVGLDTATIDGRGYYLARHNLDHEDLTVKNTGDRIRSAPFVNRFVTLDFGTLAPGERRTLPHFRAMTVLPPDQRTDEGIANWVMAEVRRMYVDAAERLAAEQAAHTMSEGSAGQ